MTPDRTTPGPTARATFDARFTDAGFSLLELLLVMTIIFVVSTLYYGGGSRGYQMRQMKVCDKNLQNIFVALKNYSLDHNGQYPSLAGATASESVLSLLIPRATTGTEFFICPGTRDKKLPDALPFADRRTSYAYYVGNGTSTGGGEPLVSDRQVNTNSKFQGQPLFSTNGRAPGNNHDKYGGNVMFADGSVRYSPPAAAFDLTNAPGVALLNPKP